VTPPSEGLDVETDGVDGWGESAGVGDDGAAFEALLEHLTRTRGFQFTAYKRSSLARRVRKRMRTVGIDSYAQYVDHLEVHPDEFVQLFNTILINVTSFFRDAEAWEELSRRVIMPLVQRKAASGEPLRIWCAGCASGQEAYTLAMLVAEAAPDAASLAVKIYATDVDEEALQQARLASYGEGEMAGIPEPLRARYFDAVNGRFEFKKELRRWAIFGRHDLLSDAPISRIDVLTCRNTMMYMNADLQEKILRRFHFALRGGGHLMLGKAEMLNLNAGQFGPVELKQRIYVAEPDGGPRLREDVAFVSAGRLARDVDFAGNAPGSALRLRDQALEATPVPQLTVDPQGNVVLVDRLARELFQIRLEDVGRPFRDLEVSFRPVELRSHLQQAFADRHSITLRNVEWVRDGTSAMAFDIYIVPLGDRGTPVSGAQITFLDVTQSTRLYAELRQTNRDLETAYEELQSASEELETTNEELQSTVEELETTTEELQSSNEELETMNEELQSTNEELQAVNAEIKRRGDELTRTNAFMVSIVSSLHAAIIVLDRELRVEVWNVVAEELWGLRAAEVIGKSFHALDIGLPVEKLGPALRAVFAQESVPSVELPATNRRGKPLSCKVTCTRLSGSSESRGMVLVIETHAGGGVTKGEVT
jgi:two-component system CheB/CheR fusion protein